MSVIVDRRRYMGKKGLSADSYIQDGLMFQLDGIDKGSNDGYWTDLVDGVKFALNNHSGVLSDSIYMRGSGHITADKTVGYNLNNSTIEACFHNETTGWGVIFFSGINGTVSSVIHKGYKLYTTGCANGKNQKSFFINDTDKNSISYNGDYILQNGETKKDYVYDNWDSVGVTTIGGRGPGKVEYPYKGIIYAVRIYNRKLSADEMLFNQHIDNVRFNLGLDL